jgi:hypothetical protein
MSVFKSGLWSTTQGHRVSFFIRQLVDECISNKLHPDTGVRVPERSGSEFGEKMTKQVNTGQMDESTIRRAEGRSSDAHQILFKLPESLSGNQCLILTGETFSLQTRPWQTISDVQSVEITCSLPFLTKDSDKNF